MQPATQSSQTAAIAITGRIDPWNADDWAARIRAALRHGCTQLELHFEPGAEIHSAPFLGMLAASARYLATRSGCLRLTGTTGRTGETLRALGIANSWLEVAA